MFLLAHRALEAVAAALFLLGAILPLRGRHGEEDAHLDIEEGAARTFARVPSTAFLVILVAELGDLTQILAANLAAKYHAPLAVGIGAVLGLTAGQVEVALPAVSGTV